MAIKRQQTQQAEQPKPDVLKEKQMLLDIYTRKFDSAVALVNQTVDNLSELSKQIETTIGEIDAYQSELSATKERLSGEKRKNDKVIQNFKALLAAD